MPRCWSEWAGGFNCGIRWQVCFCKKKLKSRHSGGRQRGKDGLSTGLGWRLSREVSTSFMGVLLTYRPGVAFASLDAILPQEVAGAMRQGLLKMNARLRGFAHPDALLTGPETRSSSPVRFLRGADCQSLGWGFPAAREQAGRAASPRPPSTESAAPRRC